MKILELELQSESELLPFQQLLEFLYTTNIQVEENQVSELLELSDR